MTPTLPEFLLARYDVAEARARRGLEGFAEGWHTVECGTGLGYWANTACECRYGERLLADLDAKRRVVALAETADAIIEGEWNATYSENEGWLILASLALPYADHPDYRPEWRL